MFIIDYVIYIAGITASIFVAILSFLRYQKVKFPPFLYMACGMMLMGVSWLFSLYGRALPNNPDLVPTITSTFQLSAVFFYPAAYILLLCFFLPQNHVPWFRLLIYAFLFGMMIDIHFTPDMYVAYNDSLQIWYYSSYDISHAMLIDLLSSLAMVDMVIHIIKRQRKGMSNKRARIIINLFWLGVALPIGGYITWLISIYDLVSFRNFAFLFCLILYSLAFTLDPLCFMLSDARILDIILARADTGDMPVGQYSRNAKAIDVIKSQALSGVNSMLNEMISNKGEKYLINEIQLGSRLVIIERTEHFTSYLIGEKVDRVCRWGLRFLTLHCEAQYSDKSGQIALPDDQVMADIHTFFTFLSKENAIE